MASNSPAVNALLILIAMVLFFGMLSGQALPFASVESTHNQDVQRQGLQATTNTFFSTETITRCPTTRTTDGRLNQSNATRSHNRTRTVGTRVTTAPARAKGQTRRGGTVVTRTTATTGTPGTIGGPTIANNVTRTTGTFGTTESGTGFTTGTVSANRSRARINGTATTGINNRTNGGNPCTTFG